MKWFDLAWRANFVLLFLLFWFLKLARVADLLTCLHDVLPETIRALLCFKFGLGLGLFYSSWSNRVWLETFLAFGWFISSPVPNLIFMPTAGTEPFIFTESCVHIYDLPCWCFLSLAVATRGTIYRAIVYIATNARPLATVRLVERRILLAGDRRLRHVCELWIIKGIFLASTTQIDRVAIGVNFVCKLAKIAFPVFGQTWFLHFQRLGSLWDRLQSIVLFQRARLHQQVIILNVKLIHIILYKASAFRAGLADQQVLLETWRTFPVLKLWWVFFQTDFFLKK